MSGMGNGEHAGADIGSEPIHHTVTIGMGCFWSPDALFGSLPGVVRTRTGYAGGTIPAPTYREMGDHSETVQITYDPVSITLGQLLRLFWDNHNPYNINDYKGRQYRSLLIYHHESQLDAIHSVLKERETSPDTEIVQHTQFWPAEDRHQKYYLHRYPQAVVALSGLYAAHEELVGSTVAARLNGLAKGYTNLSRLREEIGSWNIDSGERERILHIITQIRW
ncbi:peptide-methionine (S)-S-oxide reductase MsrA [Paenibacillus harenae]|uniref:peptide-methionine (S)-S-oxide reductase MsrA n=1 Tax=Paenibacillus harenae TaxID=306543 RepID=UPI002791AE94|nr:peptide-methionine (S)-S-oxide reductase [Paenibacillus harenae]MDQ0062214.1 peptide-methionine (S)-S-oxide reductase [Paenibacillus harenae]